MYIEDPQVTFTRNYARLLKLYKKRTGRSENEFARRAGIPNGTHRCYKTGRRWPRPEILQKICEEFGIPVEMLFRR